MPTAASEEIRKLLASLVTAVEVMGTDSEREWRSLTERLQRLEDAVNPLLVLLADGRRDSEDYRGAVQALLLEVTDLRRELYNDIGDRKIARERLDKLLTLLEADRNLREGIAAAENARRKDTEGNIAVIGVKVTSWVDQAWAWGSRPAIGIPVTAIAVFILDRVLLWIQNGGIALVHP